MADEVLERTLYAAFEKHDELVAAQMSLLDLDLFDEPNYELDSRETILYQKFTSILAEYQEQAYLLDPFLENLVGPVVNKIKAFAHESHGSREREPSAKRVERLSMLLYGYIKFRGYKAITRFFPHEIDDLPIALNFILVEDGIAQAPAQWALRYSMMLWLSLIAMIPFDLAQFDDEARPGHTAKSLEMVGKMYLGKAGLEREGAALLLSRLYIRKDMKFALSEFVRDFKAQISSQKMDIITAIGYLQVLNEAVRNGSVDRVQGLESDYLGIIEAVNDVPSLIGNTLFCKMRTKLVAGIALRTLPAPKPKRRRRVLGASVHPVEVGEEVTDDRDIPEIVETLLQQLFDALQNKDTVVRWSAAKGVARIAERLPADFASQVLDTVMDMFSTHSEAAARIYDLPGIAEGTWHGATLACAEMARRNLVGSNQLPAFIGWVSKALSFDLRKGSHSIGSGTRDAASYVLWSLARTQDTTALVPHAEDLARRLVAVALFDREIHIRRAASAAFQEHVGRASLFPHGIDVLRKTDFYAVSGRRNAFLVAAPQVAEHPEYRAHLIDHLLNVVLRHWDPAMRELGSQSLRIICELDLFKLGPDITRKAAELLNSFDGSDVQGGLLALSEISLAYHHRVPDLQLQENLLRESFSHLASLNQDILFGPRNSIVIAAACQLIGNSITPTEIELKEKSCVPNWRRIIHDGLRHRNETVQEAAAAAYARISGKEDLSDDVRQLIRDLRPALPTIQQNLPNVLGLIDYRKCRGCLHAALDYLLSCAKISSKAAIEVRRNCHRALPKILHTLLPTLSDHISPTTAQDLFSTLLLGLNDYSIDERGDVGSWVRIACVKGLTSYVEDMFSLAGTVKNLDEYLSIERYHEAVAGILKQGVERLDNVRQEAGLCFLRLLELRPVESPEGTLCLPGFHILEELFATDNIHRHHSSNLSPCAEGGVADWSDGSWLFPRAVRLLDIPEYRPSVLRGVILSLGTKTDSIQRPASTSIAAYAKSLPISDDVNYSLLRLVMDVIQLARSNITSNAVVIPVLQTFTILLEADALRSLGDDPRGVDSLFALLDLSTRNVGRLKSVQRIYESMKITTNLTTFKATSSTAIPRLDSFLVHPFPRIRADAAEYLYLLLQGSETIEIDEAAEEILLETEWSSEDTSIVKAASSKLLALLSSIVV